MSAYGTGRIYKRPKIVFKLKRLKQAGKEADRKEKHLSPEKVKRFLNNEIWAMDEQEELELATSDSQKVADAIRKKSLKLKANKKVQLRAKQPLTNKQL